MAAHYHNIHWGTHFNTLILSPPSVHHKCSESCCAVILCTGVRSFPLVFISLITLISRHWLLHTIADIAHTTTGASAPWMHGSSDSGWFNRYIRFLNNFGHLNLYTLSSFYCLILLLLLLNSDFPFIGCLCCPWHAQSEMPLQISWSRGQSCGNWKYQGNFSRCRQSQDLCCCAQGGKSQLLSRLLAAQVFRLA